MVLIKTISSPPLDYVIYESPQNPQKFCMFRYQENEIKRENINGHENFAINFVINELTKSIT